MRHKLVCILPLVVPQIPCCLDKEKPSDVPRGEVMGVQTPVESSICFSIVYAQKYCPSSAPVFYEIQKFCAGKLKQGFVSSLLVKYNIPSLGCPKHVIKARIWDSFLPRIEKYVN